MRTRLFSLAFLLLACGVAFAQLNSPVTIFWPNTDKPTLKITFGRIQKSGIVDGQGVFILDVIAQNLSEQKMPRSVFTVFLADKNNVRIGRARLELAEIRPSHGEKTQLQFSANSDPAAISLVGGKTVPLRVSSVPPGARFKVDGADEGLTPKMVDFTIGSHTLEFSKEGYTTGSTPLDVGSDELPGGSVSFELGGLSKDTVELRDGSTLLGDVISMSMTEIVLRVEGKDQKLDRNQVKKLILVERLIEEPKRQPTEQNQ